MYWDHFYFLRRSVLFSNVSLSCRTALSHLEGFGERLARERFRTDLHSHHLDWMHVGYDWLLSKEEVRSHSSSSNDNNVMTSSSFSDSQEHGRAPPRELLQPRFLHRRRRTILLRRGPRLRSGPRRRTTTEDEAGAGAGGEGS